MKCLMLLFLTAGISLTAICQDKPVNSLPAGKYETVLKHNQTKWDRGDIILIDDDTYKISTSNETGEYKFSVSAQRVFFISGPLKSVFARTSSTNNSPTIVLPVSENQQASLKIPADIWGLLKK